MDIRGICHTHLITSPIDPVDHSLQTHPFKNMHYADLINKFREQVADVKNEYRATEKDRKSLQRTILKK